MLESAQQLHAWKR